MSWMYQGEELLSAPEGYYGFIYKITDDTGKVYYGKKAFTHKKTTKLSKKARVGTRKRVSVQQVDSKWVNYWGSSKPMLEYIKTRGGTKGFKREIIKLCENRVSWTYHEVYTLMVQRVLFREDTWNGNIMNRFYKGKIHP